MYFEIGNPVYFICRFFPSLLLAMGALQKVPIPITVMADHYFGYTEGWKHGRAPRWGWVLVGVPWPSPLPVGDLAIISNSGQKLQEAGGMHGDGGAVPFAHLVLHKNWDAEWEPSQNDRKDGALSCNIYSAVVHFPWAEFPPTALPLRSLWPAPLALPARGGIGPSSALQEGFPSENWGCMLGG